VYAVILIYVLGTTEQVMHPGSPIFSSGSGRIQIYFITLVLLTLLAAWQLVRIWRKVEFQSEVQVTSAE
jgi:hypothetical protein